MKNFLIKRNKGMSLIEVLVAMGILSVGVMAVVGIFPMVFKNIDNSWDDSRMVWYAQQKMDALLANNNAISPTVESETPSGAPSNVIVKWWGDASYTTCQPIYVEVNWTETRGKTVKIKKYTLAGMVVP